MRRIVFFAAVVATVARGAGPPPAATVSVTKVSTSPASAAEETRAMLKERVRELLACYEQELSGDGEPTTQVNLSFTYRGDGSTLSPRAEFPDARMDDAGFAFLECLKGRAAGWTVRGPVAGAAVLVGLTFARRASPAPAPMAASAATAASSGPQGAVGKVVEEHAEEIRLCYERELSADPQLEGKVALRWVVEDDGSTSDVRVHEPGTTLRNRKVLDCMIARVGGWRFPSPGPGRTLAVTYPWTLRAQRQQAGPPASP